MPEVAEMTTKEAVKMALSEAESPMGPREVADASGKNYNTVRAVLRTMFNQGQVAALKNNTYCLPNQFPDVVRRVGIQGQPELGPGHDAAAPPEASAESKPGGHPAIVFRGPGGSVLFSIYIQAVPGQTITVDVETGGADVPPGEEGESD